MSLRGTSYEHDGAELARSIYGPYEDWCLRRYGFTVDDVLRVGAAKDDSSTARFNELLLQAHDLAKAKTSERALRETLS
jgi:hypothetical protein